jgi:tRNA threonylcarbamoyladenosine biosynthesis protein TsaB
MNILALDTSTDYCSAALWRDGLCVERAAAAGQSHSTLLMQMADAVLAEAGLKLQALDGIAYGEGPGSFTGLRIACAVAQGLAFAADLPVAGIGTLQAMAAACDAPRVICCLDARMQDVYPHAGDIARLAAPVFDAGLGRPAEQAAPRYIRDKVALKTAER